VKKRPKNSSSDLHHTLFLGCTVPVRAAHYELSARKVAERLDVQFHDIPEFACCGYPIQSVNHYAFLLMAARNLALAEEKGYPLCTLCSACCGALTEASHEIKEDEKLRNRINDDLNRTIGKAYQGGVRVTHFIRMLKEEVGYKGIEDKIQIDLSSLHLAPHYGCHYTKPSTIYAKVEDPENPQSLDELIEASGANSIPYESKLSCCGGGVLAMDEQVALGMAKNKLDHVQASQADGMILICPFCDIMYESNQKKIEKVAGKEYKLPVLFYPQLLGLAMGMEPDELGMKMNRVRPTELLKKINRRPG
jgi:heterodisulfide reductase subunit B2